MEVDMRIESQRSAELRSGKQSLRSCVRLRTFLTQLEADKPQQVALEKLRSSRQGTFPQCLIWRLPDRERLQNRNTRRRK